MAYKRVLIKISGEALAGNNGFGLDSETIKGVVLQIKKVREAGIDVGLVIGGGNFWRGKQHDSTMDRSAADHMGMLATVMNAIAMQDALEAQGVEARVQTALTITRVAEPYILRKALRHFEKGRVVYKNDSAVSKKRHGFCVIDNFVYIDFAFNIPGKIHIVFCRHKGIKQLFRIVGL